MRRVPALHPSQGANWPQALPRPARLLSPPEQITTLAELPDHPPRQFMWRKTSYRVTHADGPERINGVDETEDITSRGSDTEIASRSGSRAQLLKQADAGVSCDDCIGQRARTVVDDNDLEQSAVERLRIEAAKTCFQRIRLVKVRYYDCSARFCRHRRASPV